MKFKKKPITLEAVQHFNDMGTRTAEIPVWLIKACSDGIVFADGAQTFIKSLEGNMLVSDGDWIVRGVKGELYAVKPDIFAQLYDPVQEQAVITDAVDYGKIAYNAYCNTRDWKNVRGEQWPQFQDQSEELQLAWRVAGKAVALTILTA